MSCIWSKMGIVDSDLTVKITADTTEVDIGWLKAVSTVQKIESLIGSALGFAGLALGKVGQSISSVVGQAVATLTPLFAARELSGWGSIQATIGLIELSNSLIQLPILLKETQDANAWGTAFIRSTVSSVGRTNFNIG